MSPGGDHHDDCRVAVEELDRGRLASTRKDEWPGQPARAGWDIGSGSRHADHEPEWHEPDEPREHRSGAVAPRVGSGECRGARVARN
jgi:hypothetical protein